ncbi:hypothetical protein J2X11_001034 [Aeromicrobium panaciterrae]|uniref:Uncharacterized protein n=1 Tax=Aeromicrobium panaciterrae TaxID=363861 RepID=A0ABU1UM30_9ACTN|nr:hypothetical protein [Aeromicrobium panaciterrae]MDR7086195.1 hypothetical protein [Aeromicrobium panaciterrae]
MPQIFFDSDDDATELIMALEAEGYTTALNREAFAGEEDWEDRAWVLDVEPFDDRVIEMVDVYGGWMPGDEQLPAEPTELPEEPKRLKD